MRSKLNYIWGGFRQRCCNPNNKGFKNYGGRGISVCVEWLDNFKAFESWAVENGYIEGLGLTLDRINVDGNYEPSNCRWVTREVQARNTRKLRKDNTTGFRGVYFNLMGNKYRACIAIKGKTINLGSHPTPLEASYAYDLFVYYHNLEHTTNHPKESYTEEQLSQPQKPLPIMKEKAKNN